MSEAKLPGKPPTTNTLHVLLQFVRAIPGNNPFAQLDAEKVFQAMRAELADLTAEELVLAGVLADQLGRQLRSVSWRLRYGRGEPKPGLGKLDKGKLRPVRAGARRFKAGDPMLLACPDVIAQWRQHLGLNRKWRVKDIIGRAREVEELHAVVLRVAAGSDGMISDQRLGIWLAKVEGVSWDGASLRCIEGKMYPKWALVED